MALQDDINSFGSANTASELLVLAACTNSNTVNRVIAANTVNDLPDLSNDTVENGTVLFVNSLGVPVIAQKGKWTGLDNRTLRTDFTFTEIYSWGQRILGNNSNGVSFNPVTVCDDGKTNWCKFSIHRFVALAQKTDGSLWAWGGNSAGAMGDNTIISRSSPVSVVGGFTDWCAFESGGSHSVGLRSNGTLWTWGSNFCGKLGDITTVYKSSPVTVAGGFTDWTRIAASGNSTAGIRSNGTMWAWGSNSNGKLGDNTTINKSSPVSVVGGFTDWCHVAMTNVNTAGVRTNGSLWVWGCNLAGSVGDGTSANRSSPVSVVGGFTDWCLVCGGGYFSGFHTMFGLRCNGTLWSWGSNAAGKLGLNNTVVSSCSPAQVTGFTDWCHISPGQEFNLALRTDGSLWAWGCNCGGFGNGTSYTVTCAISSPIRVVPTVNGDSAATWRLVAAGYNTGLGFR